MPDVYSIAPTLDAAMQGRLVEVLETRGADAQQQAMRDAFLEAVGFPPGARVLDIGCGTGVLTRRLAARSDIAEVVGIDPTPRFIARARELMSSDKVTFDEADGRSLPFENSSFDAAVFDSTLCHVPEPERALAEAYRVVRPGRLVAIFDGDYATTTVALGDHDPLQACVAATMTTSVHDRWLARRLPGLARTAGFAVESFRSHGFVDRGAGYMLTVVERGADILAAAKQISDQTAASLKEEARRRIRDGEFFGHIAYVSLIARKPVC